MNDAQLQSRSGPRAAGAAWDQERNPVEPPVWEVTPPGRSDPTPDFDLCRRRARRRAHAQAAKTQDLTARHALEVAAVNWENLARHLARPAQPRRTPVSTRKAEARRAALGIED